MGLVLLSKITSHYIGGSVCARLLPHDLGPQAIIYQLVYDTFTLTSYQM